MVLRQSVYCVPHTLLGGPEGRIESCDLSQESDIQVNQDRTAEDVLQWEHAHHATNERGHLNWASKNDQVSSPREEEG